MGSKAMPDSCWKLHEIVKNRLILVAVSLIPLIVITGCGSNGIDVELPNDFIKDFIAKHETMVDRSLVYYYVKSEQSAVAEQIEKTCRINREKGTLESLEKATFDFSELQIELIDQKEEYVNDEPVLFLKVAVWGCYKMMLPEASQEITADEIIILKMVHNEWKVTDSGDPWI